MNRMGELELEWVVSFSKVFECGDRRVEVGRDTSRNGTSKPPVREVGEKPEFEILC